MLVAAPFRPSEKKERVCPPSTWGHYQPAAPWLPWHPGGAVSSSPHTGQTPEASSLGQKLHPSHVQAKLRLQFVKVEKQSSIPSQGELSPPITPGTPVPQLPKGTPRNQHPDSASRRTETLWLMGVHLCGVPTSLYSWPQCCLHFQAQ